MALVFNAAICSVVPVGTGDILSNCTEDIVDTIDGTRHMLHRRRCGMSFKDVTVNDLRRELVTFAPHPGPT